MTKLKTIIVDDHKIFRTGLKLLLSRIKIVEIIGEACDASELFLFVEKQRPDLVFMDLNLPGMSGIEATEKLIKLFPDIKIVVISSFDDNDTVQKVLQAGGMAYLIKNTDYEDVVEAIAQVMKGRKYFSPEIFQ